MKKVLVIEDDSSLCANILDLLSLEGFETVGASDGMTGVRLASSESPDIIICDITMFPMDGFAVLDSVRSNPKTRFIPFIFLTAKAARADIRAGITRGADDYLTKPFSRAELLDAMGAQFARQARLSESLSGHLPNDPDPSLDPRLDPRLDPNPHANSSTLTNPLFAGDTPYEGMRFDPEVLSPIPPIPPKPTAFPPTETPYAGMQFDPEILLRGLPSQPNQTPPADLTPTLVHNGFSKGQDILDRYRILGLLGEGGFGVVLRGEQIATQQQVAIKVLVVDRSRSTAREQQYKRFRREVLLTGKLSNPHTVRLIDSGFVQAGSWRTWTNNNNVQDPLATDALRNLPDEDAPVMVLEFVQGRTLRNMLHTDGALSPSTSKRICCQMLESLAEAHALGIVHRDLKPENIMITGSGRLLSAKVLDFGISGVMDDKEDKDDNDDTRSQRLKRRIGDPIAPQTIEQITRQGEIRGTPSYMAPEQLFMFSQPRHETDLYASGLILLECLTGNSAFSGSDASVCIRQLKEMPEIPPTSGPSVLAQLSSKHAKKDPDARYPSAEAMFAALDALPLFGDDLSQSKPSIPTFPIPNFQHPSPPNPLSTPNSDVMGPPRQSKFFNTVVIVWVAVSAILAVAGFFALFIKNIKSLPADEDIIYILL